MRVGPARVPRIPRIAMERTAYGRTNASLTRLRGSAQRPAEGKGLDRGFSLRQNLTPNRTARLVISGGSIVTPGATSIMVNPKRKKNRHCKSHRLNSWTDRVYPSGGHTHKALRHTREPQQHSPPLPALIYCVSTAWRRNVEPGALSFKKRRIRSEAGLSCLP